MPALEIDKLLQPSPFYTTINKSTVSYKLQFCIFNMHNFSMKLLNVHNLLKNVINFINSIYTILWKNVYVECTKQRFRELGFLVQKRNS